MDRFQIRKEIYELELRETTLSSEVEQLAAAMHRVENKDSLLALGAVGSTLAMLVPGVGLLGGGAGVAACAAMGSKFTKEKKRLQVEIAQKEAEKRLAHGRIVDLKAELREEERRVLRSRTQERKAALV